MEAITDNESRCPTLRLQYAGHSADAVVSSTASLFGNNVVHANTALDQILSSDFCFRKIRIRSVTAGRDDRPCLSRVVQVEGVVESGFEHGRRPAIVLRCSQDNDDVRWARFVACREITDLTVEVNEIDRDDDQSDDSENRCPFHHFPDHATRLRILPSKNSARASNDNGPSRRRTGGSTVRSNSVEPTDDGSIPPSTRASIESPSCRRTSSAVTGDGTPLLFALVAVMGLPKWETRVVANAAIGQRRPTVFVPAVTRADSDAAACRIIVRGPGQNAS